ncbi:MAG: SRPBCC domain-containing protein [Planctomycetales bacterium]
MAAKNELSVDPDLDFFITRTFEAPRALVYEAWTNPRHMAQWWGPAAFTNPICNIDLRPGGNYYFSMRSPAGIDYPCSGTYQEIIPNERLVMTIDCTDHPEEWYDQVFPGRDKSKGLPQLNLTQTVTFERRDGKTTLRIRTRFDSKEIRDAMQKMGMSEG